MDRKKIGVFAGSLRKGSYSKSVARFVSSLAPEDLEMRFICLADLPMYNQDLDDGGTPPEAWTKFRREVKPLDGCLFVTPEYNRSVPAVLKNALDVGSRPWGESVWSGKAGGIISVSPGAIGGFGANHHLRQSMVFLNILVMQQPEAYVGRIDSVLNEKGEVTDESARKFFKKYMDAFAEWVRTVKG